MTFPEYEQQDHRETFIKDCRQKAWGAACHADFVAKSLDELMAEYAKLKEQDDTLGADISLSEQAIDSHTVDSRQKRKEMQEERNRLGKLMTALGDNMGRGQKAYEQLLQSVDAALSLAKHAEGWSWKEVEQVSVQPESRDAG
jgi:hypothetical protein